MDDDERDLLAILQSSLPSGDKYNRAVIKAYHLYDKSGPRFKTLIGARSFAAGLNPQDVEQETGKDICKHLQNQSEGKEGFSFTGKPGFEGWVMLIVGSHRNMGHGAAVIPRLLRAGPES
jgi:hypothetical protein